MSLFRGIAAIGVVAVAYSILVFMPQDLPPEYSAGIYTAVALIAFGALAWAAMPRRKHDR